MKKSDHRLNCFIYEGEVPGEEAYVIGGFDSEDENENQGSLLIIKSLLKPEESTHSVDLVLGNTVIEPGTIDIGFDEGENIESDLIRRQSLHRYPVRLCNLNEL